MTKKYIVTQDQIQSTVGTSEYPPSSTAVKNALDQKVDKNGTDRLMTAAEGTKLAGIAEGAQVNVIEEVQVGGVAQTITNKAVNVPIATTSGLGVVKIGTGLSVTAEGLVTADVQLHFEVFQTLPTASETRKNTIALVKKTGTAGDVYNEYVCVQDATTEAWAWELIGTTEFVLTITQTAAGITINGTALQAATDSQTGLLTAADHATFAGKQDALTFDDAPTSGSANPVKSGGVYTALGGKVDKETGKSLVLDTKVSAYDAHVADSDIHVTAAQKTAWTGKQDAITSSNMLDADLVDDTSSTNKFVTTSEKTTWSGKQDALTFDTTPTASSTNPVTSGGVKTALDGKVNAAGVTTIGKDENGYYIEE